MTQTEYLESAKRIIKESNLRMAHFIADKMSENQSVNKGRPLTTDQYRTITDSVLTALIPGTDNGKAIDVLRIAHESVGLVYNPQDWA